MPTVSVAVPHSFTVDQVIERAQPVIENTVEDFEGHDLEMEWDGNEAEFSFKSLAFTIKGTMQVDEDQIAVNIELPFPAMIFKDKVEGAVRKRLTRALEEGAAE